MDNVQLREELTNLVRDIKGRNAAYQLIAKMMELLGVHPDELYQMLPELGNKTIQRIRSCMEGGTETGGVSLLSVHMFDVDLKELKNREHVDTQAAIKQAALPEALEPIRAACLKLGIRLSLALGSVTKYGNPVELVERRLRDMAKLTKHAVIHKPAAFFVHLMRQNKDVILPLVEQDPGKVQPEPSKPRARALVVGDIIKWYGERCRVVETYVQKCVVETVDGLTNVTTEQALRLRIE